ncbi:MAG: hypothetical protein ACLFVQ_05955 [Chitinispirillaceae bacterium]
MLNMRILTIIPLATILFCAQCSDSLLNPYDPAYKGNYSSEAIVNKNTPLYAFVPATVTFTNNGDDSYTAFRVICDSGLLDTSFSRSSQGQSEMQLYFTKPFEGEVRFCALRHNGSEDTLGLQVHVKTPFYLHKTSLEENKSLYRITTPAIASKVRENVRSLQWIVNGSPLREGNDPDVLDSAIFITEEQKGIEVKIKDWLGNEIHISETNEDLHRIMRIDAQEYVSTGQPMDIKIKIGSIPDDSGEIRLLLETDTLKKAVSFSDTMKEAVFSFGGFMNPGLYTAEVIYDSYLTGFHGRKKTEFIASDSTYFSLFTDIPEGTLSVGKTYEYELTVFDQTLSDAPKGFYSWLILLDQDTLVNRCEEDLKRISFSVPGEGELTITASYCDLYNRSSGLVGDTNYVQEEALNISSAIASTIWPLYTGQSTTLILPLHEIESSLEGISYWSFDGDTIWEDVTAGYASGVTFRDSGTYLIRARFENEESDYVFTRSLSVLDGSPVIDSVVFDDSVYYSGTPFGLTIHTLDPARAPVDSFIVNLRTENAEEIIISSNPFIRVTSDYPGSCTLSVRAYNVNGCGGMLKEDLVLEIRDGTPQVGSVSGDTAWTFKKLVLDVSASDPDGSLESIIVTWGDGFSDTLKVFGPDVKTAAEHVYESVPPGGVYEVKLTAVDTYGNRSETFYQTVAVIENRPEPFLANYSFVLNGDTLNSKAVGDTLVYPYVDTADLKELYFCLSATSPKSQVELFAVSSESAADPFDLMWISDTIIVYDLYRTPKTSLHPDSQAIRFNIWCKDYNGLVGKKEIYLRTDSPPVSPRQIELSSSPGGNHLVSWKNGHDTRDGSAVLINIRLLARNASGTVVCDTVVYSNPLRSIHKSEDGIYTVEIDPDIEPNCASDYNHIMIEATDQLENKSSGLLKTEQFTLNSKI